ncbi:hypothetical protein GCM10025868_15210 [Angustibacter aerolatus]|uniref:Uncharacterized protein n=1 Tax=Angustibacter aerolatus TaxID=1162965 RepID=A0ABQ6JHN0_9ACTN|nr:hypothetical protein GCM10025868_15210 [Angustibacter aerolatus]
MDGVVPRRPEVEVADVAAFFASVRRVCPASRVLRVDSAGCAAG